MGTGIPVPTTIPEASKAFIICVPDSAFFYSVVMGALKITTFKYYWNGTDDQKTEVTDRMLRMYYEYQEQDGCMICTLVEDCIANDDEVRNALGEWFLSASQNNLDVMLALQQAFNSAVPGNTVPGSVAAQNLMEHNDECDNDTAWGNIRDGIIDRGMQRVQDVLEQIELTTDNQEMLASVLDVIPVLGVSLKAVGVGSLIAFFDNVRAFLKDAFEAGDTVDKRDQMACDLFCIWQENCALSFGQIREYFWAKATETFPTWENAFVDIVTLIEALGDPTELTGDIVVNALMGAEYGFVSFINDWFGVHLNAIQGDALIGEPSDDWTTICDDCPTFWNHAFPDAGHWDAWTLNTFDGSTPTIVDDEVHGQDNTAHTAVFVDFEITATAESFTKIEADVNYSGIGTGDQLNLYEDDVLIEFVDVTGTGTRTLTWVGSSAGSHTYRLLGGVNATTADGAYINVTDVRFFGTGSDPF